MPFIIATIEFISKLCILGILSCFNMSFQFYIFFLMIMALMQQSCTKLNKSKFEKPDSISNYKLLWKANSSSVILKNCDNGIQVDEVQDSIGNKIKINKGAQRNFNKMYVSRAVIGNEKKTFARSSVQTKVVVYKDSLINGSTALYNKQQTFGYTYSSYNLSPVNLNLDDVVSDTITFIQPDSLSLRLNNCKIGELNISSDYSNQNIFIGVNNPPPILNLTIPSSFNFSRSNHITILNKEIGNIYPGKTNRINIANCVVSEKSGISYTELDTLSLYNLTFKNVKSRLNLSYLGINEKTGQNNVVGNTIKGKKQLILDDVDASLLNFDYRDFTYFYEESGDYFAIKQHFKEIIASQRLHNNLEGLVDAYIDSSKFEDQQHFLTSLFIPAKAWWNDYGYDKEKVITSSLELFALVWFVNILLFKKMLEVYSFNEISKQQKASSRFRSALKRQCYLWLLCLIYSGYLFFGLKFEINNLKLRPLGLAFWIIGQYVIGIFCLAYIANLVITK